MKQSRYMGTRMPIKAWSEACKTLADADMSRYVEDENLTEFFVAQTHANEVAANENRLDTSLTEAFDNYPLLYFSKAVLKCVFVYPT